MLKLYINPLKDIPIVSSELKPEPDDIILGYELLYNDDSFFTKPRMKYMKFRGWFASIFLLCIPCCMSWSYDICQRPVYGRIFIPNYVILRSNNPNTRVRFIFNKI